MTGRSYDAVLFDLDGTLVAPRFAHVRRMFDRVGEELGHEFSDETARRLWHGLGGSRNDQLRSMGVDVEAFWRTFDAAEDPERRAAAMEVFPDAAIAADLPVPTALVTHCPPEPTRAVLESHDLEGWFDAVVSCSDELGWKPDPGPLEHALERIGVVGTDATTEGPTPAADGGVAPGPDPTESADVDALYVGDTVGDVGAAWNAGLDAVHVERFDHERRRRCVLADYRVSRIDECAPLAALAGD